MLGSDLFPRDFIYSLEAPTNYMGPQAVFGEEPKVNMLRGIEDADAIFPPKHKNTLIVDDLPRTLLDAARAFLLSNTIRDLRGEGPTHRSMLVNVSRGRTSRNKSARSCTRGSPRFSRTFATTANSRRRRHSRMRRLLHSTRPGRQNMTAWASPGVPCRPRSLPVRSPL